VFGRIGFQEILIIFFILILLFGARKIPELARGMGQGIKEFRKGIKEGEEALNEEPPPTTKAHSTSEPHEEKETPSS
jgi:sec-independent protein translocase protein TatA